MRRVLIVTPALLLLTLLGAAPASACINGVRVVSSYSTGRLAEAEQALARGSFAEARVLADGVLCTLEHAPMVSSVEDLAIIHSGFDVAAHRQMLQRKARRLRTLVMARAPGAKRQPPDCAQLQELRATLDAAPQDPLARAEHAEGWGLSPFATALDRAAALKTLEALAADDLMPSFWGWRALASLRADAGHAEDAQAALQRCRSASKAPRLCKIIDLPAVQPPTQEGSCAASSPASRSPSPCSEL